MSPTEYRYAAYDVGGMRVSDETRSTGDLTPQQLADKLGAEAAEIARPPFPSTILVWDMGTSADPPLWLDEAPAATAAGRWEKSR